MKPRSAPGTPRLTLQHSPFFHSFLTPRTVKKKLLFFSHKKQGNNFPKDRVMIAAKPKPKLGLSNEFIFGIQLDWR